MTRLAALLLLVPSLAGASPRFDIDGDGADDAILDHRAIYYGGPKGYTAAPIPAFPRGNLPALFFALELVGDVNGDGFADVVLGDPACPPYARDMPQCEAGAVHLFLGGKSRLAAKPVQTIAVTAKDTHFGMQVVPLGDIDGDKLADIAVPDSKGVHIYKGTKSGLATTPIDLPSGTIIPVGDLDKDGTIDLVNIGPQTATIIYGGDPKRTQAIPLGGDAEFFGTAGSGDFDGDGHGDLAITVEPASPTGNSVANDVLVYKGSAKGLVTKTKIRFTRDHVRAEFGASFASAGDLNGDKLDDLVILAACSELDDKASSCNAGAAYVFLGSKKGLTTRPVQTLKPKRTNMSIVPNTLTVLGKGFAFGAYIYPDAKGVTTGSL